MLGQVAHWTLKPFLSSCFRPIVFLYTRMLTRIRLICVFSLFSSSAITAVTCRVLHASILATLIATDPVIRDTAVAGSYMLIVRDWRLLPSHFLVGDWIHVSLSLPQTKMWNRNIEWSFLINHVLLLMNSVFHAIITVYHNKYLQSSERITTVSLSTKPIWLLLPPSSGSKINVNSSGNS